MQSELARHIDNPPSDPSRDWSLWLTPRMTLSGLTLLLVALGLFGSVAAGPLLLVGAGVGVALIAMLGFFAEAGMSLRRFGALAKTAGLNILRSMADGYWAVLRGQRTW